MVTPFRIPERVTSFKTPQLQLCLLLPTGESVTVQFWKAESDNKKFVIFGRLCVADQVVRDFRIDPTELPGRDQKFYPGLFLDLALSHLVEKSSCEETGMTSHQASLFELASSCLREHSFQRTDDLSTPVAQIVDTEDQPPLLKIFQSSASVNLSDFLSRVFGQSAMDASPIILPPPPPRSDVPARYAENPEVFLRCRREAEDIMAAVAKLGPFDRQFFHCQTARIWEAPAEACRWKGHAKPFVYFDLVDVFDSSSLQQYASGSFEDVDLLEFDDRVLFVLHELLQGGVAFVTGLLSLKNMPIESPQDFYKVSCVWDTIVRQQSKLLNEETMAFFQVATRPDAIKKCIPTDWERCFTLLAYPLPWRRLDLRAIHRDYRSAAEEILQAFRETPFVSADVLRQ